MLKVIGSISLICLLNVCFAFASDGPVARPIDEQSFLISLADINSKLAPAVKHAFGQERAFLATGDWKKAWTSTSAGGSYYHPEIPGVEYKNRWGVHIAGWLARWPGFDTDTIGFVLCHELGHHVFGGGEEVAADHFTPKCLSWLWTKADNQEWLQLKQTTLSEKLKTTCRDSVSPAEQDFCLRTMTAYQTTESMRATLWKKLEVMTDEEIVKANACRKIAVLRGLQNLDSPDCRK